MALNPGKTLLNGQYRILRQLGRGGFGFVYQAQDTLLGEQVAIKELIPALVGDEAMLKRFLAEARATMRLTDKRIVRTHNIFQEGGNYYIVMECMAGGSLEERLQARGSLSVDEALRIAAEVCQGLHCAHQEGVVHCDLKPANILFDSLESAKVADFGIAHVSEEMLTRTWLTPAGFVAGTLPYMSPEQADGVRDDPRVDVYALGAVLYRMLTGRTYLDFDQRETPVAQARNVDRIQNEKPQPPGAHNRRVPAWLDGAVLKALAKEPEARYATADEMRAALLQGDPAAAPALPPIQPETRPVPPRPAPTPPPRRRREPLPALFWPLLGGAAVLLLVLVIAGIAIFDGSGDGAPTPARPVATTTLTSPPASTPRPSETPRPTPTPAPSASDIQIRDADGMEMVYVSAGTFWMGSTDEDIDTILAECSDCERDWFTAEQPQHEVFLDAFWIDRTEVTNAQYRQCVEAGACEAPTTCDWGEPTYDDASKADHPVVCVDWHGAKAYCEWAGARLPAEAEWEKAARGAGGRVYPWGNAFDGAKLNYCDRNCEYDWKDEEVDDGHARTAPVGSYPAGASPYGALDMAGNVWEWAADWYDADYYGRSPDRNPQGPDSSEHKVVRGGSWYNSAWLTRTTYRFRYYPTDSVNDLGFRCAAAGPRQGP